MDKSEYNMRAEKIQRLVKQGDYENAAKICDKIDWSQVRSVRMLSLVSSIYEHIQKYDTAMDILMMAYEEAPSGRRYLYKLTELSLASGNIKNAEAYYRDYIREASDDNSRYILRYKIAEAKGESLDKRITILEAYKRMEFDEEWAYRLALLYAKSKQAEKCVSLCDEIILWFGVGSYVDRAIELKSRFERAASQKARRIQQVRPTVQTQAAESEPEQPEPVYEAAPEQYEQEPVYEAASGQYEQEPVYGAAPGQYEQEPVYEAATGQYEQEPVYESAPGQYEQEPVYGAAPGQYEQALIYEAEPEQDASYEASVNDANEFTFAQEEPDADAQADFYGQIPDDVQSVFEMASRFDAQLANESDTGMEEYAPIDSDGRFDDQQYVQEELIDDQFEQSGFEQLPEPADNDELPQIVISGARNDTYVINLDEQAYAEARQAEREELEAETVIETPGIFYEDGENPTKPIDTAGIRQKLREMESAPDDEGFSQMELEWDDAEEEAAPLRILYVAADDPGEGVKRSIEALKAVHQADGTVLEKATKVPAAKLNANGLINSLGSIQGKDLIIIGAGSLNDEMIGELLEVAEIIDPEKYFVLADSEAAVAGLGMRVEYYAGEMAAATAEFENQPFDGFVDMSDK